MNERLKFGPDDRKKNLVRKKVMLIFLLYLSRVSKDDKLNLAED